MRVMTASGDNGSWPLFLEDWSIKPRLKLPCNVSNGRYLLVFFGLCIASQPIPWGINPYSFES